MLIDTDEVIRKAKHWLGLGYIFTYPPGFIPGNLHKHPAVTKFLCSIGRHDYEFVTMSLTIHTGMHGNTRKNPRRVMLRCFYCEQTKVTTVEGDKLQDRFEQR